jgi:hypothetical protein
MPNAVQEVGTVTALLVLEEGVVQGEDSAYDAVIVDNPCSGLIQSHGAVLCDDLNITRECREFNRDWLVITHML